MTEFTKTRTTKYGTTKYRMTVGIANMWGDIQKKILKN
jgi:hypothetical protein